MSTNVKRFSGEAFGVCDIQLDYPQIRVRAPAALPIGSDLLLISGFTRAGGDQLRDTFGPIPRSK